MIKRISKAETVELLKSGDPIRRMDLMVSSTDSTEYYLLGDGRLLLDFKSGAEHSTLFGSEKEYRDFMQADHGPKSGHLLAGFPDNEEDFLKLVDTSKERLQEMFGTAELDYDFESLKTLDKEMKRKPVSYEQYFNLLYPLLVPFVSQAIIQEMRGKWLFIYNEKERVVEPYISLPNQRDINVFVDLYEEAMEDYEGFSVYETVLISLKGFNS
jgi:hypothetical protein